MKIWTYLSIHTPQVDTQLSSILKEQDPKTDYAQS